MTVDVNTDVKVTIISIPTLSFMACFSKLSNWLFNEMLIFKTYYKQKHYHFLPKKFEELLLPCFSHFFLAKNIRTDVKLQEDLTNPWLDNFVQRMML